MDDERKQRGAPPLPPGAPPRNPQASPRAGAPPLPPSGAAGDPRGRISAKLASFMPHRRVSTERSAPPLPPTGAAGDPRGRISTKLASFMPHRRVSTEQDDPVDPESGERPPRRPSSVRRRLESVRLGVAHLHMPHLLPRNHTDGFEYAFEEEGASSGDSDVEDTDSTFAESSASARAEKKRAGGMGGAVARKVKGGLRGAGAAASHKVTERKVPQRIMLGLFAVCLLWTTSYGVARAIVRSKIDIPLISTVGSRNAQAYDQAVVERARYVSCVNLVADECVRDYDAEYAAEIARRDALVASNRALLLTIAANLEIIEASYNSSQTRLDELQTTGEGGFALGDYLSTSSASECSLIFGIVAGQAAAINALNSARQFQGLAEAQTLSLALQIENRRIYDEEFFANKTGELDLLALAMQNHTFNFSTAFASVGSALNGFKGCMEFGGACPRQPVFQSFNDSYNQGRAYFTDLQARAVSYRASVSIQLDQYAQTITALDNNFETIRDSFIPGLIVSIPSSSDANEPSTNIGSYVFNVALPSSVTSSYDALVGNLTQKLGVQEGTLSGRSEQLRASSNGWQTGWDDDYDPPNITANDTVNGLFAESNNFIPGLTNKLSAISDVTADERESLSGEVNETSRSLNGTSQNLFVKLTNHSEWDFYSYGDEVLTNVEGGLQDMSNLLLIFDTLFRILHTIFIIRKYWNLTGLATPSGDARVKQDVGAGWGPKRTPLQRMAALATNPLVLVALTALTIALLLYAFWWAYNPLYFEYVDSCVNATYPDIDSGRVDGTMLYRNGYEAMYQYAASEGDQLALERTDDINVGRDVQCTKQQFNDIVLYNQMAERYNELLTRYTEVANQNNALGECLVLADIDTDTATFPVPTNLVAEVSRPEFTMNYSQPDELAIYNCTAVAGCPAIRAVNGSDDSSLCKGPQQDVLKSLTHRAACTSENWFHAYMFGGFMILSCFILLNIGRIVLMRGLVRILWRQVIVNNFSFLASCDDRGDVIYPERVTEKGDSMQVAIREAVKKALRRWQIWGAIIFASGFVIQAPWIWGLYFLSNNLRYR